MTKAKTLPVNGTPSPLQGYPFTATWTDMKCFVQDHNTLLQSRNQNQDLWIASANTLTPKPFTFTLEYNILEVEDKKKRRKRNRKSEIKYKRVNRGGDPT